MYQTSWICTKLIEICTKYYGVENVSKVVNSVPRGLKSVPKIVKVVSNFIQNSKSLHSSLPEKQRAAPCFGTTSKLRSTLSVYPFFALLTQSAPVVSSRFLSCSLLLIFCPASKMVIRVLRGEQDYSGDSSDSNDSN